MKAPSAPTLPKCRDCGEPQPRVVGRGNAHVWLCASCEYTRSHPDAAPERAAAARAPAEAVAAGETLLILVGLIVGATVGVLVASVLWAGRGDAQ